MKIFIITFLFISFLSLNLKSQNNKDSLKIIENTTKKPLNERFKNNILLKNYNPNFFAMSFGSEFLLIIIAVVFKATKGFDA